MLRSEAAVGGVIRLSTVTEAHISRQVELTDTAKHPQVRLEQRKQTFRPILMHLPAGIFLLCVIDVLMHIALHPPIATGGVRIKPTPPPDGEVGCLLHRLDGAIFVRSD